MLLFLDFTQFNLKFEISFVGIHQVLTRWFNSKKLTNQKNVSPRKVSISKSLFFNTHENEAAKFNFLLWLAAAAVAAPTMFIYI